MTNDPNDPTQPDLVIEAYGTVTPPDTDTDDNEDDES